MTPPAIPCEGQTLTGALDPQKAVRVGAAVDVIVVSPQDVERYGDSHALVIKPALREGRVVYEQGRP